MKQGFLIPKMFTFFSLIFRWNNIRVYSERRQRSWPVELRAESCGRDVHVAQAGQFYHRQMLMLIKKITQTIFGSGSFRYEFVCLIASRYGWKTAWWRPACCCRTSVTPLLLLRCEWRLTKEYLPLACAQFAVQNTSFPIFCKYKLTFVHYLKCLLTYTKVYRIAPWSFCKKWANPGLFFVYFRHFLIKISII